MGWDVQKDGRALQRIVALLFALAKLAERAAAMPFARRAVALAILSHAEAAAWAFALGTPRVSSASSGGRSQIRDTTLPDAPDGVDDSPAGAARLACSLRLLAMIVARWATEALSSEAAPSLRRRAIALKRAGSGANWLGPAAPPAPDTS